MQYLYFGILYTHILSIISMNPFFVKPSPSHLPQPRSFCAKTKLRLAVSPPNLSTTQTKLGKSRLVPSGRLARLSASGVRRSDTTIYGVSGNMMMTNAKRHLVFQTMDGFFKVWERQRHILYLPTHP